eukprot:m.47498 g.47498  ORF g.47498 m.47498 type:complete len:360 (-) comp11923_c0_seq1:100-1179(-)
MALPALPPAMKILTRYLKVADEFNQRDPVVAYFCRFYAVQLGVEKFGKDKANIGVLMQLMDVVEQHKSAIRAANPTALDDMVAKSKVWEVGMKLFSVADREDRAGRITKAVAKTFFTASCLFDVLSLFGEEDDKTEEVHDYAKWKAAYITKCLREGIPPVAGPVDADGQPISEPGADGPAPMTLDGAFGGTTSTDGSAMGGALDDLGLPSVPTGAATEAPFSPPSLPEVQYQPPSQPAAQQHQQPSQPAAQPYQQPAQPAAQPYQPPASQSVPTQPPPSYTHQPPAAVQPTVPAAQPAAAPSQPVAAGGTMPSRPRSNVSFKDKDQVTKHCKYVISALQYNDLPTAIQNLQGALKILAE